MEKYIKKMLLTFFHKLFGVLAVMFITIPLNSRFEEEDAIYYETGTL